MNAHLSEHAMLRWQLNEATEQERTHVADCPQCRKRLAPMTAALCDFGAAARNWGPMPVIVPLRRFKPARPWSRFALATAVVCLLLLATGLTALHWQHNRLAPEARVQPAAAAPRRLTSDDALLEAVDQDVSREVPEALQPLSLATGTSQTAARP